MFYFIFPRCAPGFSWLETSGLFFVSYQQFGWVSDPQVTQLVADWVQLFSQLMYSRGQVRVKSNLLVYVADVFFRLCSWDDCLFVPVVKKPHYQHSSRRIRSPLLVQFCVLFQYQRVVTSWHPAVLDSYKNEHGSHHPPRAISVIPLVCCRNFLS